MSKAFTKETDDSEEDLPGPKIPKGLANYITPGGLKKLKDELHELLTIKRPELTAVVAWAAGNGDRSENADYTYGKRKLREYDRRIRFLTKRIESAQEVNPLHNKSERVFFGATVTVEDEEGVRKTYSIVGVDEIDLTRNRISWVSPLAVSLLKARVGDIVTFKAPAGTRELEIIEVAYLSLD